MLRMANLVMRLLLLMGLFVVLFSYAMFQGGFVSWFLFYATLPFLIYYLCFIFYPVSDWKVDRILPITSIQAGDSIRVRLVMKRRLPMPFSYLMIQECLPSSLNFRFVVHQWSKMLSNQSLYQRKETVKKLAFPLFSRTVYYEYQVNDVPRGVHTFTQVKLSITDLFGFVSKTMVVPVESVLLIRPRYLEGDVHWPSRLQQLGEASTSMIQAESSNVVTGAREYVPGDRVSSIHWKATAKTETLMTKEFDQEQHNDGVVALAGSHGGVGFEWNLTVAYGLIQNLTDKGHKLDFCHLAEPGYYLSTEHRLADLHRYLTVLPTGQSEGDISPILHTQASHLKTASFLIVFTDQLTIELAEYMKELARYVKVIRLYWTKAEPQQSEIEKQQRQHLQSFGVIVDAMTEREVAQNRWVVRI
ncbi:DUF58 domain-containing protein [Amphibacillus cookii]|uniref:DUF58 domain-containing protein n=1 Tax=Amphibacillus cookii TaxID=767787 RepID=UPI00195C8C09|nr:DUF58 domain-containing protein [Amphibacillus cookii]MBM7542293.1 uncharacterized protein (DUF58 family) [Amphibacillus cookii]